jgi:hypothetical protein
MNTEVTRRDFLKTSSLLLGAAGLGMGSNTLLANAVSPGQKALGLQALAHTHDMRLPDWGCYTNLYNGLSHIADKSQGLAFELGVFPGLFRRGVLVPNVKWESGFHPWEAAPDLSYFSYRYELMWKDKVYCDVSFTALDESTRMIRAEFVNNTDLVQNAVLHYMGYIYYARVQPYSTEALRRARVLLPEGALWVDAIDYEELQFGTPQARDNLTWSGRRRAEVRTHGSVTGSSIGHGYGSSFGRQAGDKLVLPLMVPETFGDATLLLRYRSPLAKGSPVRLRLTSPVEREMELPAKPGFELQTVSLGRLAPGKHRFTFVTASAVPLEVDGFAVVEAAQAQHVRFEEIPHAHVPELQDGPVPQSLLLKYKDAPGWYGLAWRHTPSQVREIHNSELDMFLRRRVQDHVSKAQIGDRNGHFTNVFMRPVVLAPGGRQVVYGLATTGTKAAVESTITQVPVEESAFERLYTQARAKRHTFQTPARAEAASSGEQYLFSQERMAATLLTNAIYPVYTRRSHIRHYVPGKWWDSIYTWDAGFIGLGLAELDFDRAIDCLNSYTTVPGDPEAAFLHVGTPIAVQIFLFLELWNRTQSRELLEYFYPRLRQYHMFLAGRHGSSTTRRLKSNLLTTWDYFYNTGWDDYPPQKQMHEEKLARLLAPVITTAYTLRTAKILRAAAKALGEDKDVAIYGEDIDLWTDAIQRNCWDADSGYYSYVMHDVQGMPTGIWRHSSGQNFNMGMDGTTPIVAGIGTPAQFQAQLANLKSDRHLWTRIGLSTVDQSASYYRKDGYWNGAVWMPHQWFVWKAMLDWGEGDFAWQIARTALNLWHKEVDESYHCFEHFLVDSGRGAGWHQFGALSAPVLNWFAAYHLPGKLTAGFDAWIHQCNWSRSNRELDARVEFTPGTAANANLIAAMNSGAKYLATWNGSAAEFKEVLPGVLQISVPRSPGGGQLRVTTSS